MTALSKVLEAAADLCDEAEAPEVETEAQELVTSAFRARGSIDEMVVRLDLAGGDFLGELAAVHFPPDPAYTAKVPPGDPQPKQPEPTPDPQPQPQPQEPPPPPTDEAEERLLDAAAELSEERLLDVLERLLRSIRGDL